MWIYCFSLVFSSRRIVLSLIQYNWPLQQSGKGIFLDSQLFVLTASRFVSPSTKESCIFLLFQNWMFVRAAWNVLRASKRNTLVRVYLVNLRFLYCARTVRSKEEWFVNDIQWLPRLEKVTVGKTYSIPRMEDIFDQFGTARMFSKVKLVSEYHGIRVLE